VTLGVCAALTGATPAQRSVPDCIDVWAEARSRAYGYDHVVHLASRCDAAAVCDVATNVNPVSEHVTVLPRQAVEVLTFRGSPSREFTPRVDCRLLTERALR
jgi:hypothetical protein